MIQHINTSLSCLSSAEAMQALTTSEVHKRLSKPQTTLLSNCWLREIQSDAASVHTGRCSRNE